MKILNIKLLVAAFIAIFSAASNAACSDSEYRIYQQYDKFLDTNPSTPDYELRIVFAKNIGMQPSALKDLYVRCVNRWANQNQSERDDYLKKLIVK